MAGMKSFRQIVQVRILGIGGYLCLEGELSAGGIVAASIIVGRALAPIELAVSQWKVFQNARGLGVGCRCFSGRCRRTFNACRSRP